MAKIVTLWSITPPPGLTKKGDAKRFSDKTVQGLQFIAQDHAEAAIAQIQERWDEYYPDGEGRLPGSLRADVQASNTGVSVKIKVGQFKHLPYISVLGGDYRPNPYYILPVEKTFLRWRDKHTGKIVIAKKVVHPGFGGRDLLAQVIEEEGELFRLDAMQVVSNSILTLNSVGSPTTVQHLRRR